LNIELQGRKKIKEVIMVILELLGGLVLIAMILAGLRAVLNSYLKKKADMMRIS
jgi:hypothetical protein